MSGASPAPFNCELWGQSFVMSPVTSEAMELHSKSVKSTFTVVARSEACTPRDTCRIVKFPQTLPPTKILTSLEWASPWGRPLFLQAVSVGTGQTLGQKIIAKAKCHSARRERC